MGFGSLFKRNKKEKTLVSLKQKEKPEVRQEIKKEQTQITQKKVLVSKSSVPSGCKKYLGYLHERPEKSSKDSRRMCIM